MLLLLFSKKIFIIIAILFGKTLEQQTQTPQCLDPFALISVDVRVHEARNSRANLIYHENFNLLDKFVSIDIISANVTQLCEGMIKNFPIMEALTLININLTGIEPAAFQNLPKLKHLSLAVNQIKNVNKGVFNNLISLKTLYLTKNQIEIIESEAFSNMPQLKSINLEHNKISQLNGNLFSGSSALTQINFSYNMLNSIDENSFADLTTNQLLTVYLKKNKINTFHPNALRHLPIIHLHLEYNEMVQLADVVQSAKDGSKLYFNSNRISCVADNVIESINTREVDLNIENNPLSCECVERIEESINKLEMQGYRPKGEITMGAPCTFPGIY